MQPEIMSEVVNARLADRRREAALARRVMAARRADARSERMVRNGRPTWRSRATSALTAVGRRLRTVGRAARPGLGDAR